MIIATMRQLSEKLDVSPSCIKKAYDEKRLKVQNRVRVKRGFVYSIRESDYMAFRKSLRRRYRCAKTKNKRECFCKFYNKCLNEHALANTDFGCSNCEKKEIVHF